MANISPTMLAGITRPDGGKQVSAEAADIINRLKNHYKALGKDSAAHNYSRHLKSLFAWAEGVGYSIHDLPSDAVESFLASLAAAGQKETTLHVMRTQLKSAMREAESALGLNFGHIEFRQGKPDQVRTAQKAKEKQQRAEKRLVQAATQMTALQAAQATIFGSPMPVIATPTTAEPVYAQPEADLAPDYADEMTASPMTTPEDSPMSDTSVPQNTGSSPAGASQQPVVVLQMPPQAGKTAALNATANNANKGAPPERGVRINNLVFNGAYIKLSYIADGASPMVVPGTEVAIQIYPTSQIAMHGDVATFLQAYVIPTMRLAPTTGQVQFIFTELNDKRLPTGRKDEMVVSVPAGSAANNTVAAAPAPAPVALAGLPTAVPAPTSAVPAGLDRATEYLLNKLDRDAEEAKRRADELQEKMRQASDAHTAFILQQQFQKEQDLRREIESERRREMERAAIAAAPPPAPMMPSMPFPTILPPEPKADATAEFAKALADSQARMMELMLASINRPVPAPPPPPPQKDMAEWIVPLMSQMNQQAIQQQQSNQAMLMQVMQANQQFMQALVTRESPELRLMMEQMREVRAAANAPKADELESFADKLQKMKMVSDMLGGGGSTNLLGELLANADTIGAGAAKVIAAAKSGNSTGALNGAPTAQRPANGAPQLTAGPQQQGAPAERPAIPAPPEEALAHLQGIVTGVEKDDDQAVVNGVIELVKVLNAAPEPYPMMGRRILTAFQNAEDEGELYTLAKNLWTILGQQFDRPAAKAVAKVLARWYSVIHQQVFGEPKSLADEADEGEDETIGDETGANEAAVAVGA